MLSSAPFNYVSIGKVMKTTSIITIIIIIYIIMIMIIIIIIIIIIWSGMCPSEKCLSVNCPDTGDVPWRYIEDHMGTSIGHLLGMS